MFHYIKKYNTGISPEYLPRSDLPSVIRITVSWDLNRRQLWASEQEARKIEDHNLILFHLNLVNDRLEPNLNILFHNEYKWSYTFSLSSNVTKPSERPRIYNDILFQNDNLKLDQTSWN